MNAQELFLKNGISANVWYCSECRFVKRDIETATDCCVKNNCKYCGKLVEEKYWLAHRECIEKDKMEKAEKLDIWDGGVFYEDKYYTNTNELVEALEGDEYIPEYVYICKIIPFPAIEMDCLIESIEESSYGEIGDQLNGLDKLTEAINEFNETNKDLVSYLPDETKMVKISKGGEMCKQP